MLSPTGKSFRFVRACERARRGEAAWASERRLFRSWCWGCPGEVLALLLLLLLSISLSRCVPGCPVVRLFSPFCSTNAVRLSGCPVARSHDKVVRGGRGRRSHKGPTKDSQKGCTKCESFCEPFCASICQSFCEPFVRVHCESLGASFCGSFVGPFFVSPHPTTSLSPEGLHYRYKKYLKIQNHMGNPTVLYF